MQEVYRALDRTLQRDVALKAPKNTSGARRFQRSAVVSARVIHPNVARTFDYFEEENRSYLVEELMLGKDLRKRLDDDFEYLDPHLAAHVLHHLAKGLAALHHAKVFHRDLKPSNVMVSGDPGLSVIKITDFGIAKMAEAEFEEAISKGDTDSTTTAGITSKTVLGAAPYMAPEMFRSPKEASLSADIWAIAALTYHLCAGEPPFGYGIEAIAKVIDGQPPEKPNVLETGCSRELGNELWEIISKCLVKNPSKRPNCDSLVGSLSQLCYSTAPRELGTITSFRKGSGNWGFISTTKGTNIFFHRDAFHGAKRPEEGMRVSFTAYPGSPSPRAFPVLLMRSG